MLVVGVVWLVVMMTLVRRDEDEEKVEQVSGNYRTRGGGHEERRIMRPSDS